jgi:hypothetical protein
MVDVQTVKVTLNRRNNLQKAGSSGAAGALLPPQGGGWEGGLHNRQRLIQPPSSYGKGYGGRCYERDQLNTPQLSPRLHAGVHLSLNYARSRCC